MNTLDMLISPTSVEEQLQKIESRNAKVGVIGLGYVGLPLSLLLTEAGFTVKGFDIDERKVSQLEKGLTYIFRIPETDILLARERGFTATTNFEEIANQDVVILCVPTPLTSHREPDLSFIRKTAEAIAPWLRANQLIVLESTSYPGTTEEVLIPILNEGNRRNLTASCKDKPADDNVFYVAFSPEREDPGNNTIARCDIPKVVGGHDLEASRLASALYGTIFTKTVYVSSTQAAEMTKLLENIYRCVNIALVNELKILSLRMGIDIWEVIDAAKTKPFGFQAFYPGPGLGGHCIPIDPFYLSWKARESDFHTRFIELAGEINESMPRFVVQSVSEALNTQRKALNGSKILVLGVAYKRDVDDLRESPALEIIELLKTERASVDYNDPYFPVVGRGRHYDLGMTCTSLDEIPNYDCVVIVTDHSDYDYAAIVDAAKLVVDTRNATRGIQSSKIVHC
jgi:UDP-N-acetyl-D-glucosamine dehydrogenase